MGKGGNPDNIKGKGFESRSTEEVREIARRGGVNSGLKRRTKKSFREAAKWVLEMETSAVINGEVHQISQFEALMLNLWREALDTKNKHHLQALQMLQSMIGDELVAERMKAETDIAKAKAKLIKSAIGGGRDARNGMMEDLIKGLKESDDLHEETESPDADVANGETQTSESS